jgi:lysophospholipase L1-like esterase
MNTNPSAKKILVYGDSLPWGVVPGTKTFERFPANVRWPGQLQQLLGNDFAVIEENLCARTLDSDDPRPGFEGRNGQSYIVPCLDSHDPIDTVIISLGLNEIKSIYDWTPKQVADKMKKLIQTIRDRKSNFHETNPRIIILTQPEVIEERAGSWGQLWIGSHDKSTKLAEAYRKLANELGVELCDINKDVQAGADGVHLDESAHHQVAEELAKFF